MPRPALTTLLEVAVAFGLLIAYMWWIHNAAPGVALVLLGGIILSWRLRGDTLRTMGLQPEDFRQAKRLGIVVAAALAALIVAAWIRDPGFPGRRESGADLVKKVVAYYGWALFQQLLLNGYFVNRLAAALGKSWPAALVAGALFALAHLPNLPLSAATLVGGAVSAAFFLKSRNLYPLALAHAVLAVALPYLFRISMNVGPGRLN